MTPPPDRPEEPNITASTDITSGGQATYYATKADIKDLADKQKHDQNILLILMSGVVIVVVITFWLEASGMYRNYAQDKSILLQNNQLNKDYFEKILLLNNEINDISTQMELLKARNPYLK